MLKNLEIIHLNLAVNYVTHLFNLQTDNLKFYLVKYDEQMRF